MITIVLIALIGVYIFRNFSQVERELSPISQKVSQRLQRLWGIALSGMREKKYLRAEKALLTILKLDQTNAAAYNRLGILYSRQKEYKDAIECFEIASSIEPSASSLHNLGLIYYETENYEKAASAFEGALKLEDGLAARFIAYAKVLEKLGNQAGVIDALETAVEIEPSQQSIRLLAQAHREAGNNETADKLEKSVTKSVSSSSKRRQVQRPKRVIY